MKHFDETRASPRAALVFPDLIDGSQKTGRRQFFRGRTAASSPETRKTIPKFSDIGGRAVTATLSFSNLHKHGELFADLLRLRKRIFIEKHGWSLPESEGMEFDQYDTPCSRWVVIHRYGVILAGARLTPTTAKCGIYSYMIRDAQRGLLENIPSDMMFTDAPVNPRVWEVSRIFIVEDVPAVERLPLQMLLISRLISEIRSFGGRFAIGIVPKIWPRWIRRIGVNSTALGPVNKIDGNLYQVVLMSAVGEIH